MAKGKPKEKKEPPASVNDLKGWDKIKNQRIGHFLIVPTFLCSLIFFGVIFLVLIAIGIGWLAAALSNADFKVRYDNLWQSSVDTSTDCTFTFSLDKSLSSPHIYYEIDGFYANHRKYVMSRSYEQLRGNKVSGSAFCSPISKNEDIPVTLSYANQTLEATGVAYPCGLIAKYRFTDRFSMSGDSSVTIDSSGIAQSNDKNIKFKNIANSEKIQWLDFEEEHLMVWYQMESFPTFIKLYGKIDGTMSKGNYTVTVTDQWDTKQFKAKKSIYFSTVNGLGGTNVFLGAIFISIAFVVAMIMGTIVILEFTKGSKPSHYSLDNLKW